MDNCFNSVYKGKRVIVTGHTGFKGAWLSLFLKELGAEVLGYALEPPTDPNFFESIKLEDKIIHVIGDIRDENKVNSIFQDFQPEFVFHLAAQALVRLSYREPKLTYNTNIIGTINLFEAIKKLKSVRVIVNITSDKCYKNKEWLYGYREIDPMGGKDPYSSSKGCAELISSAYRSSFFNPEKYDEHKTSLSSVRAGNVIGGGDWGMDRLVPDCIKFLCQNKTILIRNPEAIRPWQYIFEPLSGYLWLGALMYQDGIKYNGAWNFGPDNCEILTVEQVVDSIIRYWGKGNWIQDKGKDLHEATFLKLDCSKANAFLRWKPAFDIHMALEETIHWYKEYYSPEVKGNMYNTSLKQLLKYIEYARKKHIEWSVR